MSLRLRLIFTIVALGLGVAPATAESYSNGNYPLSALSPIYSPTAGTPNAAPLQVLAKGRPAASWNTLNLGLWQMHKPLLYSAGDGATYRICHAPRYGSSYTQDYAYRTSPPGYAAVPCTSRHGAARAVDLGAPGWMRPLLDRYGPPLGWYWGRFGAPTYENWHVEYHGSSARGPPDPGVSPAHPYLRLGSGGRYQAIAVAQVQRRLLNLGFYHHRPGAPSTYNENTRLAVYTFQVARRFKHPSGTVTRNTWIALRQGQAGAKTAAATTHAVAKLSGLKHGSRGPAVSTLSRDLAFVRHHRNHALNFYHGPVLKFFTVGLAGALRAWQTDNGLSATAVYDAQSQKVMGTSLRYWRKKICVTAPANSYCVHPKLPAPAPAPSGSRLFSDISGNNSSVDLRAYVATGHHIIAIKLVEGDGFRSDSAAARWKLAGQLAMTRMAYDFARPSQNSCTAEADNFAAYAHQLGWHRGDIAVLDWEDPGFQGRNGDSWVKCWASRLAGEHIRAGVIYSYGDYIAHTLSTTRGMGYWHAQYSGSQTNTSTAPAFARAHLVAVQFTDGQYGASPHSMPGIGVGDVNRLTVVVGNLTRLAQQ